MAAPGGKSLLMRSTIRILMLLVLGAAAYESARSEDGNWVWTFVLVPENGSTRLIQP